MNFIQIKDYYMFLKYNFPKFCPEKNRNFSYLRS